MYGYGVDAFADVHSALTAIAARAVTSSQAAEATTTVDAWQERVRASQWRSATALFWCVGARCGLQHAFRALTREAGRARGATAVCRLLEALAAILPRAVSGPSVGERTPASVADAHFASLMAGFWTPMLAVAAA